MNGGDLSRTVAAAPAPAMAVWHRRAGKYDIRLHYAAVSAMQRPGNNWHCQPEFFADRRAIWTSINAHTGRRRIDAVSRCRSRLVSGHRLGREARQDAAEVFRR